MTVTEYLCFSAQRRYMRSSISAKSAASTPPAPARIVTTAGRGSYSPFSRVCTSSSSIVAWTPASSDSASAAVSAAWPSSSSAFTSSTSTSRSSRRRCTAVMRASSDCAWLSALVTFCAASGSSQRSGAPACSLSVAMRAFSESRSTTDRTSSRVLLSEASRAA